MSLLREGPVATTFRMSGGPHAPRHAPSLETGASERQCNVDRLCVYDLTAEQHLRQQA